MSIFDKDCPRCGSAVSVSAESCGCGFSFDPDSLEKSAQDLEMVAQDEQMYEHYLAARVSQADAELESARIALNRDPENPAAQGDLVAAEKALEQAKVDWQTQAAKLEQARKAADVARRAMDEAREAKERKRREEEARQRAIEQAELAKQKAAQAEADRRAREKAQAEAQARREAERLAREKAEAREKSRLEAEKLAQQKAAEEKARREKQAEIVARQEAAKQSEAARLAAKAAHERQMAMAMALVSRADDDIREAKRFKTKSRSPRDSGNNTASNRAKPVSGKADVLTHPTVAEAGSRNPKEHQPTTTANASGQKILPKDNQDIPVLNKTAAQPAGQNTSSRKTHKVAAPRPDLVQKAQQAMKVAAALLQRDAAKKKVETKARKAAKQAVSPDTSRQATVEFKEAQAKKASSLRPLPNQNAAPTCPHCTAKIKPGRNKCGCGYELAPSGPDENDLKLNDNDLRLISDTPEISITLLG